MTNPLLRDWQTPFGIAPFDQISDDDFAPALDQALAAHQQIEATPQTEPPAAANVVEALETYQPLRAVGFLPGTVTGA